MKYIADLHTHSCYSRATSKFSNLEGYYQWARVKGINLVGTGDFTHPQWLKELKTKLKPDGGGFFTLKNPPKDSPGELSVSLKDLQEIDIRFCLSVELSTIYKKNDKTRKVHSVVFAPDFDVVEKIRGKLLSLGKNLSSDGRPILGLDTKDLLDLVLGVSEYAYLIPAHVWTPWFSLFGSNSGFDSIEDCFEELTPYIFALETGLSSDPEMNWRWSALDKYTLISNSDAHSPGKLGREANVFDTDFTYNDMFQAVKTGDGYEGTIEFYPEEGKYHLDGHRKCGVCLEPDETRTHSGLCPQCGKKLTVGTMHRVLELADRSKSKKPENAAGFKYLIPLPEVISEITGTGPATKSVFDLYSRLLGTYGNEFNFLFNIPIEDIEKESGELFAEAVKRMRSGYINPNPGFDGEYGVINVFEEGELIKYLGQHDLFPIKRSVKKLRSAQRKGLEKKIKKKIENANTVLSLNPSQTKVLTVTSGSILVTAGPGTGKTKTLTQWIYHLIRNGFSTPEEVLAITFTHRAADEMKTRINLLLGRDGEKIRICTFHQFCFDLVKELFPSINSVYDDKRRLNVLSILFPELMKKEIKKLASDIKQYLEHPESHINEKERGYAQTYLNSIKKFNAVDLSSLISGINQLFKKEPARLRRLVDNYRYIAIDELQDINSSQYTLVKHLISDKNSESKEQKCLLAIGDPDQAIYGFRGSHLSYFYDFKNLYNPVEIFLDKNYRSTEQIVKAGEAVIFHNSLRKMKSLTSEKGRGDNLLYYKSSDILGEGKFIAKNIEQLVGGMSFTAPELSYESGSDLYSFSDIAVLARTRSLLNDLIPFLSGAGIPLRIYHAQPLMDEKPFSYIFSVLSYLVQNQDIVALHDIFTHLYTSFSEQQLSDILPYFMDHPEDPMSTVENFLQSGRIMENHYADAKDFFSFSLTMKETLENEGVAKVLSAVFHKYIRPEDYYDHISLKKEVLCEEAEKYGSDLNGYLRRSVLYPYESESSLATDKVHLLTFHAAKGNEFPIVFIAGASEGVTPLSGVQTDIEEERRLFYVAMTRAKEQLIITSSSEYKIFGTLKKCKRSRFVGEIPESLLNKEKGHDISKKEESYNQAFLF
ncbi:MAG: UvrD-helicase domain-containing protein [Spirochaetales bacterium]|nr:UvrD-helicase domain-containing protein [Spirochaetales bacterium]